MISRIIGTINKKEGGKLKNTIVLLTLFLLFSANVEAANQTSNQTQCDKAILSLMWDDINKAVDEYHGFNGIQEWNNKILKLEVLNGLTFEITIQLDVFVGAHNTIGTDTLTFKRESEGMKLLVYKHSPSKNKQEILDWYFKHSAQP